MYKNNVKSFPFIICVVFILILGLGIGANIGVVLTSSATSKNGEQVTLRAVLTDLADPERWQFLFQPALEELRTRHPNLDIQLNYTTFPYNITRTSLLDSLSNNTNRIDLVSVDQIWLGEFAEKGLLTDLTNMTKKWGRLSDFYEANLDGMIYNDKIYGIWAWTDVRGIWYWKDILNKSNVNPDSLKTWNGYLASIKKINNTIQAAEKEGNNTLIQPMHLNGDVGTAVDMWYPYLWMLGGSIVESRPGHPTKDLYWFPGYNSTEGVQALEFLKKQIDIGLKPQTTLDIQFVDRKFAVMLSGSWMPSVFPDRLNLEQMVGFLPAFPAPNDSVQTSTMTGGWQLSIPSISTHKDLAWELIAIMLEPKVLAPWLEKYGYLPTQTPIGEGPYSTQLEQSIPYYREMISMIEVGRSRPSIPEYPEIANHIKEAIDEVFYGLKEPKQALDDAAAKSARSLGW
jgi:multiple sugar transport system substrate-binding protein